MEPPYYLLITLTVTQIQKLFLITFFEAYYMWAFNFCEPILGGSVKLLAQLLSKIMHHTCMREVAKRNTAGKLILKHALGCNVVLICWRPTFPSLFFPFCFQGSFSHDKNMMFNGHSVYNSELSHYYGNSLGGINRIGLHGSHDWRRTRWIEQWSLSPHAFAVLLHRGCLLVLMCTE